MRVGLLLDSIEVMQEEGHSVWGQIRVTVGGGDGEVMYAGSLTGTANGVVQLNVKLPPLDVPAPAPVPVIVAVGDAATVAAIYLCNCGH